MQRRVTLLRGSLVALVAMTFGPIGHAAKLAGVLKETQGPVLVNVGDGYRQAQPNTPLKLGDRVLTREGAEAVIVQGDGCLTRLTESKIFTLQTPSVCQGGVNTVRQLGLQYAQAIGEERRPDVPPTAPGARPAPEESQPEAKEDAPKKKKKSKAWWALLGLLALGGNGGGSSSSTPAHP